MSSPFLLNNMAQFSGTTFSLDSVLSGQLSFSVFMKSKKKVIYNLVCSVYCNFWFRVSLILNKENNSLQIVFNFCLT